MVQNFLFFFFFFPIGQFLAFKLDVYQNFCPKKDLFFVLKLSPSLFFLARKVLFSLQSVNCIFSFKLFLLCPSYSNFPQFFVPKNSFFSFQAQPQLVSFWPKKSSFFFFGKLLNFLPLHFNFSPIFGPKNPSFLARQITPPTRNGHAPPPTESRKSSQSVNPSGVRAW